MSAERLIERVLEGEEPSEILREAKSSTDDVVKSIIKSLGKKQSNFKDEISRSTKTIRYYEDLAKKLESLKKLLKKGDLEGARSFVNSLPDPFKSEIKILDFSVKIFF